ncbi:MAG: hypothetical protein J7K04_16715 [Spirochaetales bacterium]|nr:hypothetical protein [Spirochaetales bacterium]
MKLETAGRGDFENPDEEKIKLELARLDDDENNFASLSDANGFLQTAKTGGGYLLEYRDETGYYSTSSEDIPLLKIQETFLLYLKGNNSWKNNFEWIKNEDRTAGDSAAESSAPGKSGFNPVDNLLNNVKKRAVNAAKKKLRGFFK